MIHTQFQTTNQSLTHPIDNWGWQRNFRVWGAQGGIFGARKKLPNNFGVFTENVPLNGSGPVRGLLLQRRKDSDPNRKRLGGGISTFPNLRREEWQSLAKKNRQLR